jgi:hypothetical protein
MVNSTFSKRLCFAALTALPFLAGCGKGTAVSGTVTYKGQPVQRGVISFYPVNNEGKSQGANAGGEVVEGKFTVHNVVPGKNKVVVAGGDVVTVPNDRDEGRKAQVSADKVLIPEDAVGNNQVHEVSEGRQTLDLKLEPPVRRPGEQPGRNPQLPHREPPPRR